MCRRTHSDIPNYACLWTLPGAGGHYCFAVICSICHMPARCSRLLALLAPLSMRIEAPIGLCRSTAKRLAVHSRPHPMPPCAAVCSPSADQATLHVRLSLPKRISGLHGKEWLLKEFLCLRTPHNTSAELHRCLVTAATSQPACRTSGAPVLLQRCR